MDRPRARISGADWGIGSARAKALLAAVSGHRSRPARDQGLDAGTRPRGRQKSAPSRSVRLLPAFDQYVVAASLHVRQLLPGDFKKAIFRPQGWISPVLLVGGRMDGVWRHEKKGKRLAV